MVAAATSGTYAYTWVGVVGGLLGVVGLIGASIAVLRSSIATNTIKLLQDNNSALHEQNSQQAQTIELQTAKIAHLEDRSAAQDHKISYLEERVDAKAQLAEIALKVDQVLATLKDRGVGA